MASPPRPHSESWIASGPHSGDERLDRLGRLLAEYSAKLKDQMNELERFRQRRYMLLTTYGLVTLVGGTVLTYVRALQGTRPETLLVAVASALLLCVLLFQILVVERARDAVARRGLATSAAHVAQLVRRISQIEEHTPIGQLDRIELDLRLTEAEVALAFADEILLERSLKSGGRPKARRRVLEDQPPNVALQLSGMRGEGNAAAERSLGTAPRALDARS